MPRFVSGPLGKLPLSTLSLAPGEGAHRRSLPASLQAPPLLNSSAPGRSEPVTPINRGCIHQEGAWAVSALKPGKTSGSCQLEVGEVREVGRFLPGLPGGWPGLLPSGSPCPQGQEGTNFSVQVLSSLCLMCHMAEPSFRGWKETDSASSWKEQQSHCKGVCIQEWEEFFQISKKSPICSA